MEGRILAQDTNSHIGEEVKICGWVQVRRDHGKIVFLDVLDRSGVIQVVLSGDLAGDLHPQDVVCIEGEVAKRPENLINPNLDTGTIELQAKSVDVLSRAAELPFDMGGKELKLQLPTLLDYRGLTLRHPKIRDIFKVEAAVLQGFRKASEDLECLEIVTPTIAASATEGGAEVFRVNYYGYQAYLTQSPQLYKQILVAVYERVFTITKAYRAEPSVTTRHLAESTQMDCEFAFVNFNDLVKLLDTVSQEMIKFAAQNCKDILKEFGVEEPKLGQTPVLRMREAQEIIFKETGRDVRSEKDLGPQDEIDICKWALKNHESDLVIITHYPTKKRAFYTMPDSDDPEFSLSYDVLFKGMEICSGSQRVHDYQQLMETIKDRGMDPKTFEIYLMAFKYGMPPEGGFSFGLERITKQLLNLENIRESTLFPRDMERVDVRLSTFRDNERQGSSK
ncbi:MAG: aspartate--tRNA(Asn) ligase [Candidatus Daviesbacteria bacterium]